MSQNDSYIIRPSGLGKCTLVGAGPGDPELLTLKAVKAIQAATVLLVDDLVNEQILQHASPAARIVHVGKRGGCKSTPQAFIHQLMVNAVHDGENVVRLKGGDPFVFGRGGEEAQALQEARIPFTVVPGITSAIGVPAAAGIPVTHRNVSPAFTVVTGHRESGGSSAIEWESLAKVGGTIVVLMGVAERALIAQRLMDGGLSADTPVAAVRWGTRAEQHTTRTTLAELGAAELKAPSTIVIGAVAAYEFIDGVHVENTVAGQ
jgi:uroporphyrin-III C-methyltransferase